MSSAREARLRARPGPLGQASSSFDVVEVPLLELGAGEVLVRNRAMSVEPYMRLCLDRTYGPAPATEIGAAPSGSAIGVVESSRAAGFAPGDLVISFLGWRDAFVAPAETIEKLRAIKGVEPEIFLSVLGTTGFTAYVGMTVLGAPKPGETVLVSGAAGAVGSVACQIAKRSGAKVIGLAGSDEKCAWLRDAGIPYCINYRAEPDLVAAIRQVAPEGIHVYFDNVGGEQLEAALELARPRARFVECGMISTYRAAEASRAPRNLVEIIARSITMYGYSVADFMDRRDEFVRTIGGWVRDGSIRFHHSVYDGLEAAPHALDELFEGSNMGKSIIRLG